MYLCNVLLFAITASQTMLRLTRPTAGLGNAHRNGCVDPKSGHKFRHVRLKSKTLSHVQIPPRLARFEESFTFPANSPASDRPGRECRPITSLSNRCMQWLKYLLCKPRSVWTGSAEVMHLADGRYLSGMSLFQSRDQTFFFYDFTVDFAPFMRQLFLF